MQQNNQTEFTLGKLNTEINSLEAKIVEEDKINGNNYKVVQLRNELNQKKRELAKLTETIENLAKYELSQKEKHDINKFRNPALRLLFNVTANTATTNENDAKKAKNEYSYNEISMLL